MQTNLHLVHDGIRAQDVVFLLGVRLCVLYGPGSLSAGRQADHHQDLKHIDKDEKKIIGYTFSQLHTMHKMKHLLQSKHNVHYIYISKLEQID